MVFDYGPINALHQKPFVSFGDKSNGCSRFIHVSGALSGLTMQIKRESKIEFL